MQDFPVEGVRQMFGCPIFEGRNEILLWGKALKFGGIYQKYALKLIKIWKIIEKILEKNAKFSETLNFLAVHNFSYGKNEEYNRDRPSWGVSCSAPRR